MYPIQCLISFSFLYLLRKVSICSLYKMQIVSRGRIKEEKIKNFTHTHIYTCKHIFFTYMYTHMYKHIINICVYIVSFFLRIFPRDKSMSKSSPLLKDDDSPIYEICSTNGIFRGSFVCYYRHCCGCIFIPLL